MFYDYPHAAEDMVYTLFDGGLKDEFKKVLEEDMGKRETIEVLGLVPFDGLVNQYNCKGEFYPDFLLVYRAGGKNYISPVDVKVSERAAEKKSKHQVSSNNLENVLSMRDDVKRYVESSLRKYGVDDYEVRDGYFVVVDFSERKDTWLFKRPGHKRKIVYLPNVVWILEKYGGELIFDIFDEFERRQDEYWGRFEEGADGKITAPQISRPDIRDVIAEEFRQRENGNSNNKPLLIKNQYAYV